LLVGLAQLRRRRPHAVAHRAGGHVVQPS